MESKDKGYVLCIDLTVIPDGVLIKDVIKKAKEEHVILYDGLKLIQPVTEHYPFRVLNLGGEKGDWVKKVKFIDINDVSKKSDLNDK